MIQIQFSEPTSAKWKRWRKDCDRAKADVCAAAAAGTAIEIGDLYRRKSIKQEIYFSKTGPFRGKCAYCECYITDFQHGDMEHFRPKLGVTDEADVPITINNGKGELSSHPGYYWLAFDADNLLPSCTACNQPTTVDGQKIGKHNRFPVMGSHARDESEVATEGPYLINPLKEDPAPHLSVDTETGMMKPETVRGEMCVKIFGLNIRDRLPECRKKAVDEVRAKLITIIHSSEQAARKRAIDELLEIKRGSREYTLAARAAITQLKPISELIAM